MSNTIQMLKQYVPYNEQEKEDIEIIINAEQIFGDILNRTNKFCHLTSSAFVINKQHTKILSAYHNLYNSWSWLGGHADGDDDMLYVAKKELVEESGLKDFNLIGNGPISVEILPVSSHIKRGKYVASHTHLNITYLFEADEEQHIQIKEDENSNIAWLTFDELLEKSTEAYMLPVYKKIIERINKMSV